MAGLVDNIFGITQRQYEEQRQKDLQALSQRLSRGPNSDPGKALLGAKIGDYLGVKFGVAMGGTDPRQEARDNDARMKDLNASILEMPNVSDRLQALSDAALSVGDHALAAQYAIQAQQIRRADAATQQTAANRAEVKASNAQVLAEKAALRNANVAYAQDPTDENRDAVLRSGGTPASIASINSNDGVLSEAEVKNVKLGMLQKRQFTSGAFESIEESRDLVNAVWDSIYNPAPATETTATAPALLSPDATAPALLSPDAGAGAGGGFNMDLLSTDPFSGAANQGAVAPPVVAQPGQVSEEDFLTAPRKAGIDWTALFD